MSFVEKHGLEIGEFASLFDAEESFIDCVGGWAKLPDGDPNMVDTDTVRLSAFALEQALEQAMRRTRFRQADANIIVKFLCLQSMIDWKGRCSAEIVYWPALADRRLSDHFEAYDAYGRAGGVVHTYDRDVVARDAAWPIGHFGDHKRSLLDGDPPAVLESATGMPGARDQFAREHRTRQGWQLLRVGVLTLLGLALASVFAALAGEAIGLAILFAAVCGYCLLDYASYKLYQISVLPARISLMSTFGFAGLCLTMVISAF